MKNLTKIFMMVAAGMLAFSCVTDATEDLGVNVGGEGQTITVSLGEPETLDTKVQFGTKDGDTYPLRWNVGDVIVMDKNYPTDPLTESSISEDGRTATFTLYEGYTPSTSLRSMLCPNTSTKGTATQIVYTIPAEQQYYEDNIDPMAMVLYGSIWKEEGVIMTTPMKPTVGVLRIAVKGNGEVLKGLTVEASDASVTDTNIAGVVRGYHCDNGGNYGEGTIYSITTPSNLITMVLPEEGLTLGEEEQVIYVAVRALPMYASGFTERPPKEMSYGKMKVTLTADTAEGEKQMVVTFDTTNEPIKAGVVREFKTFTFAPNGGEITINDEADLVMFAKKAVLYTKATVTANLDMNNVSAEDLANFPIEGFGAYEFDGGNFEISNLTTPLFGTTEATIKNVKLTNVNINETARDISAALACQINGGSLENCSATGALTISAIPSDATELKYAGLVGVMTGESITNCTNNVNISCTATNIALDLKIGGIVSTFTGSMNTVTNNGKISFTGTSSNGLYIGGVLNTGADNQTYTDCNNYGNIYINGTATSATDTATATGFIIGGVVNTNGTGVTWTSCHNYGNITLDENTCNGGNACYIGGFSAYISADYIMTLSDCSNDGDITVKGYMKKYNFIGGMMSNNGKTGQKLTVNNFINSGDITFTPAGFVVAGCQLSIGGIGGEFNEKSTLNFSGTIANKGTIKAIGEKTVAVGGLFGKLHDPGNKLTSDSLINIGDIEVSGGTSDGTLYVGGLVGNPRASDAYPTEAQVFCDISVVGAIGTVAVGMIAGRTFNDTLYATNCQAGGRIAKTATTETIEGKPGYTDPVSGEWVEGTEDQIVVVPTWITLDDSNYLQYLCTAVLTEEQATTYNLTCISEAPTVE